MLQAKASAVAAQIHRLEILVGIDPMSADYLPTDMKTLNGQTIQSANRMETGWR